MSKRERIFGNAIIGFIALVIFVAFVSFLVDVFRGNFTYLAGGSRWMAYSESEY
jgi:hypothetical protein